MPRSLYPQEKSSIPIAEEAGRACGQVWPGAEYLNRDEIRTTNSPTFRSLYRLCYASSKLRQCENEHVTDVNCKNKNTKFVQSYAKINSNMNRQLVLQVRRFFISNKYIFLFSFSHIFQEYLHRNVQWIPGLFIKCKAAGA